MQVQAAEQTTDVFAEVFRRLSELGKLWRLTEGQARRPRSPEVTAAYTIHTPAAVVHAGLTDAEANMFARLTGACVNREDVGA